MEMLGPKQTLVLAVQVKESLERHRISLEDVLRESAPRVFTNVNTRARRSDVPGSAGAGGTPPLRVTIQLPSLPLIP